MEYIRLSLALFLPWLGGYFWLKFLGLQLGRGTPNQAAVLGYGLFLGYFVVQALLLAQEKLTGTVSFWPILSVIGILCGSGAYLLLTTGHKRNKTTTSEPSTSTQQLLFWLFICWAGLHLTIAAIEVVYRPIFPWDAWLNWMYRAKAWFFAGTLLPMDPPDAWLRGEATSLYNVGGNTYPTFPSIMAVWTATALGKWSETLVNLPVLLCGIAMSFALYGQCRQAGLARWLSALACYLLVSIPLIGTHLSLAGLADIWMAGFTGLGFTALVFGIARQDRFQILLGLMMAALALTVKNEGILWLLAACITLALALLPRVTLAVAATVLALFAIAWLSGLHYVELPMLGGLGFSEGRLHIPLIGNYLVMRVDLLNTYLTHFYYYGTWHLLWPLVCLGILGLAAIEAGPLRRAILAFLAVIATMQMGIFGFTEQGLWAESGTAINRLPLHFAPALVFCLALIAHQFLTRNSLAPSSSTAQTFSQLTRCMMPVVSGLIIAACFWLAYAGVANPATEGQNRSFSARDLQIVSGGGHVEQDTGIINQFADETAVLSSGYIYLDADRLKVLEVHTSGENSRSGHFFWRQENDPENPHTINIGSRGKVLLNLGPHASWSGRISEFGLLFEKDGDTAVELNSLQFMPQSMTSQLKILLQEWTRLPRWSQKSINFTPHGTGSAVTSMPLAMTSWLLVSALLALALFRSAPSLLPTLSIIVVVIFSWGLLDIRWTANSIGQARETTHYYQQHARNHLDQRNDWPVLALATAAKELIGHATAPVAILGDSEMLEFELLRLKYQLLPIPAYVHQGTATNLPRITYGHIIVVEQLAPGAETPRIDATTYSKRLSTRLGHPVRLIGRTEAGMVLKVERPAP